MWTGVRRWLIPVLLRMAPSVRVWWIAAGVDHIFEVTRTWRAEGALCIRRASFGR